ncbi:unnamed protein product, partial [Coccothraustes coccothraustes]
MSALTAAELAQSFGFDVPFLRWQKRSQLQCQSSSLFPKQSSERIKQTTASQPTQAVALGTLIHQQPQLTQFRHLPPPGRRRKSREQIQANS